MVLIIDIGNSCVKWGTAFVIESDVSSIKNNQESNCTNNLGISNSKDKQEFSSLNINIDIIDAGSIVHANQTQIDALLDKQWQSLPKPDKVLLMCVAQPLIKNQVVDWVESRWGLSPSELYTTATSCGVVNAYSDYRSLGVDRWAALIAVHKLYHQNTLVVDCGTAMTLDLISADGKHLGGFICPGLQIMADALNRETSALPYSSDFQDLEFADNTYDAISNGLLLSAVSVIERAVQMANRMLNSDLCCIIAGGDAKSLLPLLSSSFIYDPYIVLKGALFMSQDKVKSGLSS